MQAPTTSSPEPSHSHTRKPRLRKQTEKKPGNGWSQKAQVVLKHFKLTDTEQGKVADIRLSLSTDGVVNRKILTEFKRYDPGLMSVKTALACVILRTRQAGRVLPTHLLHGATALERLTSASRTLAFRRAEINKHRDHIANFMRWYFLLNKM